MKRRDFLRNTAAASAPLVLNGFPVFASPHTGSSFFDALAFSSQACGKVLVIIQQNGGNDGLNTVIPLDRYSELTAARSNILIPNASVLRLSNGTPNTGLNPAMTGMKSLYDSGKLVIVQSVSYPNPNYSHFRATDIWMSGSASNQYLDTGWLGRELDITYPAYPGGNISSGGSQVAYPNAQAQDPLAIQIGSTLPFSLQGPGVNMGYNFTSVGALQNMINQTTDPAPANDYGRELTFVRQMQSQSNVYRTRVVNAYGSNFTSTGNALADQLKSVAKLIGGGLTTPIYIVNHPYSHDTHSAQVNDTDHTIGTQATNLRVLSEAISIFQTDLEAKGVANKVTGMTYSEFGRRVKSNDSVGTDHGTSAPVFFFGAGVGVPGTNGNNVIGTSPVLPANAGVNDQVPMQYDFRQLYATVMQDWLCMTPAESSAVLGSAFTKVPIFKTAGAPLPLDGVSLTGQYYGGQSRLNCHAEQNGKYEWYALEFSTDGARFSEVGRQLSNTLTAQATYVYTHTTSASKMFYRIAAKDHQGKVDYSNTVLLRSSDKVQLIRVFPNPVSNDNIHVEFFEKPGGPVDVTIYDLIGSKIYYNRFSGVQNALNFRVPSSFSRETHYILEVAYGDTKAREQIIFR